MLCGQACTRCVSQCANINGSINGQAYVHASDTRSLLHLLGIQLAHGVSASESDAVSKRSTHMGGLPIQRLYRRRTQSTTSADAVLVPDSVLQTLARCPVCMAKLAQGVPAGRMHAAHVRGLAVTPGLDDRHARVVHCQRRCCVASSATLRVASLQE